MKKLVALLLVCCMLFGYTAAVAENILDSAFIKGAEELLNSINLLRDMVTLNVEYLESSVFSAKLKGQENLIDLSAATGTNSVQAQVSETDISVAVDGQAFNLKYSDVEALIAGISAGAGAAELEVYQEIITLLLEKAIMPDVVMEDTDGIHITYHSDEKNLLARLSDFLDAVMAEDKYSAALEQVLLVISKLAGGETMTLAQFRESLEDEKARLETRESDFAIDFEFTADSAFTKIDISGGIGTSADKYAMTWAYRNDADSYKLDGLLWETRVMGEKTRKYEITVKGDFRGNKESNLWSFSITHPSIGFNLEASGNTESNMGSFCLYYNHLYRIETGFMVQVDYAVEDDGLIATALVTPGRMGNYIATLVAGEKQFNLTVKNYSGRKLFLLNLLADDEKNLKYGYMECQPDLLRGNPYNPRIADTNKIIAEYDGEKLVIKTNGFIITCTAAFESDHAYVITLHAEGENVKPEEDTAYIRLEYEGEEGNFTITGRVIDPTGKDYVAVKFACAPTEGITEFLRDREGVIKLTPETLQMMLNQ